MKRALWIAFKDDAVLRSSLSVSASSKGIRFEGGIMSGRKSAALRPRVRWGAWIIGLIALESCLVFAQGSTAVISGVVRDASGAVVPGVSVTAKHIESGLTRTAVSNENGGYNVQLLPVGAYEITAELPGFKQQVRRGINLVVGQEAVVNLTLEVGTVAETVTVTGEAPIVNTTLASTAGLVNESQIKDLPLNGRGFDQLMAVAPGTINYTSNVNLDRKSTRLNSSHVAISYAVFCLKK